jgi:hypothetical protein
MISLRRACDNHDAQDANSAAVCSRPPSEVGAGIMDVDEVDVVSGRKYMYI